MAITRSQQAKQMLQNGGRIGFFKGAQADASAGRGAMSPGTSTSGGGRGGGRDPMAQFQQIQPGIKGPSLSEDARKTLEAQRKRARGEITPST